MSMKIMSNTLPLRFVALLSTQSAILPMGGGPLDKPYHFHILTDYISKPTLDALNALVATLSEIYPCKLSSHTIDDSIFQGFRPWGFEYESVKSYSAYYRLLVGRILPRDATKCLYLDSDMLVLCDVRELFALDLGTHILASNCGYTTKEAKWDRTLKSRDSGRVQTFEVPYYFCSGLMLINLTQWRKGDIESKCLDCFVKYELEFPDQDALNVVIKGNLLVLPAEYGLLIFQAGIELNNPKCNFKGDLKTALQKLKIAHFNGPSHPWLSKYNYLDSNALAIDYPYIDEWWSVAFETPIFCDELRVVYDKIHSDTHIIRASLHSFAIHIAKIDELMSLNDKVQKIAEKQSPLKYYTKKWGKSIKKRLRKLGFMC